MTRAELSTMIAFIFGVNAIFGFDLCMHQQLIESKLFSCV